jgi:hypothetical protein
VTDSPRLAPPIVAEITDAQIDATYAIAGNGAAAPELVIEATVRTLATLMAACTSDHRATTMQHNIQIVTHALKEHFAQAVLVNPRPEDTRGEDA